MLWDQLKSTIWTKCWGLLSRVTHCHTVTLQAYASWTSSWSILHIVLIWLFQTITSLVHSETLWDAAISPVTMKWKKLCVSGLLLNWKHSFLWAYTSLWTAGLSVLKRMGTIQKKLYYCTLMLIVLFNKKLIAVAVWLILVNTFTTDFGSVRAINFNRFILLPFSLYK
jgi:hypothetical protein